MRLGTFAVPAPLHHVDFNLTLPKSNDQCDARVFGKPDYTKNYFRFTIRIKSLSNRIFTAIYLILAHFLYVIVVYSCLLSVFVSLCSRSIYLFVSSLGNLQSPRLAHTFAVWTFYTVMRAHHNYSRFLSLVEIVKCEKVRFPCSHACAWIFYCYRHLLICTRYGHNTTEYVWPHWIVLNEIDAWKANLSFHLLCDLAQIYFVGTFCVCVCMCARSPILIPKYPMICIITNIQSNEIRIISDNILNRKVWIPLNWWGLISMAMWCNCVFILFVAPFYLTFVTSC